MKTVFIFKGLPGSGKSTKAKEMMAKNPGAYKRVNKDDLRAMLDNSRWSKHNEKFIERLRNHIILESLKDGFHILVDDTNLHSKHEKNIRELTKGKAKIEIIDLTNVTPETCIKNDLKRANSVGSQVIMTMYRQFLESEKNEKKPSQLRQNADLPKAIICDLDGTLALLNGRNPYDAAKSDEDAINVPIQKIVENFYHLGYKILFFTGRQETHRNPSLRFLERTFEDRIEFELHMRKATDIRKDSIIKKEMFEEIALNKYFIEFILDDRNQVVDMWRALGLTCLQVNYGDF